MYVCYTVLGGDPHAKLPSFDAFAHGTASAVAMTCQHEGLAVKRQIFTERPHTKLPSFDAFAHDTASAVAMTCQHEALAIKRQIFTKTVQETVW